MSTYERALLPGAHSLAVPSQGDEPHRTTAQNQCGWCAAALAAASPALSLHYAAREDALFVEAYSAALAAGSALRAAAQAAPAPNPSGENVDHPALLAATQLTLAALPAADPPGAPCATLELHPALKDLSFYPECEREEWFQRAPAGGRAGAARLPGEGGLRAALAGLPAGQALLVGRFHEAFCATRLGEDAWLVLDSHVRHAGCMSTASLHSYIEFMQGGEAYSLVVLVAVAPQLPGKPPAGP